MELELTNNEVEEVIVQGVRKMAVCGLLWNDRCTTRSFWESLSGIGYVQRVPNKRLIQSKTYRRKSDDKISGMEAVHLTVI